MPVKYDNTPLHFRIAPMVIVGILVLSLALLVGMSGIYSFRNDPDRTAQWLPLAFFFVPLLILTIFLYHYYTIRMEAGWVYLKGLFHRSEFALSDVDGYALSYLSHRGAVHELLFLLLPDGSLLKINSMYYRNYDKLREALIGRIPFSPELQARTVKKQKWEEFVASAVILSVVVLIAVMYFRAHQNEMRTNTTLFFLLALPFSLLYIGWKYRQYAKLP